ncbi:MAG TPA: 6-phosphofructokinase [Candidatus Methanoperedens sp.]|nr:6-phosphofructokinase [Candidatus Methanoperedens sp.]
MTAKREIRKVGMLFSGGPAPAANAVISAAALAFLDAGAEVIGFLDGYTNLEGYDSTRPLVEGKHYLRLTRDAVAGIRNEGAIILRTARANPGKTIKALADLADPAKNAKLVAAHRALADLGCDALISLGGDDTLKTANFMYLLPQHVAGLAEIAVVHLPKTIDNDYYGIDWTFGHITAADFAAREVRQIRADSRSMSTWWVLEIMGRKAGWLTYAAAIGGEACRMLSVEDFPGVFDPAAAAGGIVDLILARAADGRRHGVVCIAEGLADHVPEQLRPKEVDEHGNPVLAEVEIGRLFAGEIEKAYLARTGKKLKVRAKQIGYETRCAQPVVFDVLLGSQLGVGAYRALVEEGRSGVMISVEGQLALVYRPFATLVDAATMKTRVRFIEPGSDFHRLGRALEYRPATK